MPSPAILESKKAVVASLAAELRKAKTLVVADPRGLTVEQDTAMRTAFRKSGMTYKVVKNTLAAIAARDTGLDGLSAYLAGPSAIGYSETDVVLPAKLMKEYADKFEKFNLKGGAMEGRILSLEDVLALAATPPREELLARVVGGLMSPIAGLVLLLSAIQEKMEGEGAATAAALAVSKEA